MSGVRWIAWPPGDGFGNAAHDYIAALDALGIPVTWTPLAWEAGSSVARVVVDYQGPLDHLAGRAIDYDTLVVHIPPGDDRWLAEADGRRTALYTTWETDEVPTDWLPALECYDAVLVPSTFNADALKRAGASVPVHVVPHIATAPANVEPARFDQIGERYVFYVIASWSTRKAMGETVSAFLDAFDERDDIALVVKTTAEDAAAVAAVRRGKSVDVRVWPVVASLLAGRRRVPEIQLIVGAVPPSQIAALHARGDCFFSLTRSEGWGLCISEALTHGNPVVVTGWGGHLDYLGADYPLLVDYDLVPTDSDPVDDWFDAGSGHRWAKARHDHAVDLLRWVAANPEKASGLAAPLGQRLARECGPDAVGRQLVDVLGLPT